MKTKMLGNSDLEITAIGLGAWAIGGPWKYGWGPQDDNDSINAIHEALDLGMNWIDTAAVYGTGHSEEVVGKALKSHSGKKPYIFTKCSRRWDSHGEIYSTLVAESIREECENSLKRLGVDRIDLYQLHWPKPDEDLEEGWGTLAKLQAEGKVRYIGVSNFNVDQLKRVQTIAPVTSLQPPYSLLARDIETDILPFCKDQNIGVIVYSPMRSGLLSGSMTRERITGLAPDDWRKTADDFTEPKLTRNLALVDLLASIGLEYNVTAGEVAIAWTLPHQAVTGAIVGIRKPGQAKGVIGAASIQLAEDDIKKIQEFMAKV